MKEFVDVSKFNAFCQITKLFKSFSVKNIFPEKPYWQCLQPIDTKQQQIMELPLIGENDYQQGFWAKAQGMLFLKCLSSKPLGQLYKIPNPAILWQSKN